MAATKTSFEKFATSKLFQAVIQQVVQLFIPGQWKNYMQWDYTNELTWQAYIGATRNAAAASVISFISDKPERTRKVIKSASGDIPTIGERFTMDKRQMRRYLEMKNNPAISGSQLFQLIFNDLKELQDSVQFRLDIMFWEGFSKGEILTDITNNPDGTVDATAVDLGMGAAQKIQVRGEVWSNTAATPLTDIKYVRDTYYKPKGLKPVKMYMRESVFENMVNTNEVRSAITGIQIKEGQKTLIYAPATALSLENVNLVMKNMLLPEIELVNETINIEKYVDGVPTMVSYEPFSEYNVVFTVNPNDQGRVLWTFANESLAPESHKSYATYDNALFSMWRENGAEIQEIELNAFPVFDNIQGNVLLNTNDSAGEGSQSQS